MDSRAFEAMIEVAAAMGAAAQPAAAVTPQVTTGTGADDALARIAAGVDAQALVLQRGAAHAAAQWDGMIFDGAVPPPMQSMEGEG